MYRWMVSGALLRYGGGSEREEEGYGEEPDVSHGSPLR